MALNSVLRRSASSLTPLAARLLSGQRSFSHHASGGALFTAVTRTPSIASARSFLVPSVSHRYYSAKPAVKRPSSDETLIRVIESEIKCSEDSFEEGEDIPDGFPFELNDNAGQQTVSLTREYQGETIVVDVEPSSLVTGQEDDDDDDADDDTDKDNQSSLPMVVKVSKAGGPCLEFGVTAYADEIVIESLSVKDPEMTEDQLPYEGPRFDELDENLQKAFHKYLEIRGIKPSATNFLHEYMVNKEHREYTNWLKNLKKFVEA